MADLENDYLARIESLVNCPSHPRQRLRKAINKHAGTALAILQYCETNFTRLILGTPDKLAAIIQHFDTQGWNTFINAETDDSMRFKNKLLGYFGYSNYFRSEKSKAIWFADQLNIKACPYCNSQFTLTIRTNGNPKKARFQFDHFFSKSVYPYLSLSMYNLVPSCADCNLSKSDVPVNLHEHYHPYYSSIADRMKFQLNDESVVKNLLAGKSSPSKITTECVPISTGDETIVREHCRIFDIEGVYGNHTDYAEELVLKAILYPESKRKELFELGIFRDQATFKRYVLGNYPYTDDILKRPLAKFTQDIARQLKLID